jgi:hypothetical protein
MGMGTEGWPLASEVQCLASATQNGNSAVSRSASMMTLPTLGMCQQSHALHGFRLEGQHSMLSHSRG